MGCRPGSSFTFVQGTEPFSFIGQLGTEKGVGGLLSRTRAQLDDVYLPLTPAYLVPSPGPRAS